MNIAKIKEIMKTRNITYEKLSAMSGIPLNTLKNIFRGKTANPRIDTVEAIESALGVDFSQSNVNTAVFIDKSTNALTKKETRLLDAFNGLIPPMQDYILDMIEKLVAQPQNANKRA